MTLKSTILLISFIKAIGQTAYFYQYIRVFLLVFIGVFLCSYLSIAAIGIIIYLLAKENIFSIDVFIWYYDTIMIPFNWIS